MYMHLLQVKYEVSFDSCVSHSRSAKNGAAAIDSESRRFQPGVRSFQQQNFSTEDKVCNQPNSHTTVTTKCSFALELITLKDGGK